MFNVFTLPGRGEERRSGIASKRGEFSSSLQGVRRRAASCSDSALPDVGSPLTPVTASVERVLAYTLGYKRDRRRSLAITASHCSLYKRHS
jgi:hypothetical protein